MTGFQSRVRDVINQAAPTFSTAAVSNRGLAHFVDPSVTGLTRFMQKAGYPFSLLTPQMSALLTETAAAGTQVVTIEGVRLLDWLIPGMGVSFELLEDAVVDTVTDLGDGLVEIALTSNLTSTHATGSRFRIRDFPVQAPLGAEQGDGALGAPAVEILSPFILVPGDVLTIDGATFTLSSAEQTGVSAAGYTYEIKLNDIDGFPELSSSDDIIVTAKPAYQSEILTVPQAVIRSLTVGPVAVDWVSGPMVADYFPDPESEVYIEEFDAANVQTVAPRLVPKNDTLLRFRIRRDQMLFWKAAEGGVNWNGTFMEMKAFESGRAHLWTPCRPGLDAAPPITTSTTVPGFAPYQVLLLNRIVPGSVTVLDAATKAEIPGEAVSAKGVLTAVDQALITDGDTFVLDDGVNPAVTFEFDDDDSVVETPTLRQIALTPGLTAAQVRDLMLTAVNLAAAVNISASALGAEQVSLTNTVPGAAGNVPITQGGTAPLTVSGMSGGTDPFYTVDDTAGTVNFDSTYASVPVLITYRPRLEWQITARADVDDVEICVKVGDDVKQCFTLTTANVSQVLTIQADSADDIDQLHITARRADDSAGAFTVQFGDWQPRGGITAAIRYTLTTAADIDYDWASSGLIFKPLWPTIELLRARLDGDSIFSRYLDNGRMLV